MSLIAVSIPVATSYGLITFYFDKALLDFMPGLSDDIYFWHQISTFREAGFNGGYYAANEMPPAASFIHFCAHGPVFTMIVGGLSHLTGWNLYSPVLFNIAFFTLAIIVFLAYTKPNNLQLLLFCLVILTCWPVYLYMASNMRLVLFESLAVIFTALFYKTLIDTKQVSVIHLSLFFITILVMVFLKITNALLFIPFILLIHERIGLSWVQGIFTAVFLIGLSYSINTQIIAPFPFSFDNELFAQPFGQWLDTIYKHASSNMDIIFNPRNKPVVLMLRIQLLLSIAAACWIIFKEGRNRQSLQEGIFILSYSGLTLVATVLLYEVVYGWKDFRLLAPIIMSNTLLFIARKRWFLAVLMLAGNLMVIPDFISHYGKFTENAFPDSSTRTAIEKFSNQLSAVIEYDRDGSGWDNTLLVPMKTTEDRLMLGVPPGIGISYFKNIDKMAEIKSRYLLLDQHSYEAVKDCLSLEYKQTTVIGKLYINKGEECGE